MRKPPGLSSRKVTNELEPHWTDFLMLAEKWGVPPYQLERELTPYWFNRAVIYYDEISNRQHELQKKAEKTKGKK